MKTIQEARVYIELSFGVKCDLVFHETTPEEVAENVRKLYLLFNPEKSKQKEESKKKATREIESLRKKWHTQ